MCYPKPGPRCSAHAYKKYIDAQQKVLNLYHSKNKNSEKDKFNKKLDELIKIREEAKKEYYVTPAGILELEQECLMNPNSVIASEKLETAKAIRKAQIDAVKQNNLKQIKHEDVTLTPASEQNLRFSKNGEDLSIFNSNSNEAKICLEEGYLNAQKMTDKQMVSFRWYSADGYLDINKTLSGYPEDETSVSEENKTRINETVAQMDSFFEKVSPRETPISVYRRHLLWNKGKLETESGAVEKHFPVGSEYTSEIYMSTSLSPDTLIDADNISVVNLEIITKTGVSIAGVSSHANTELEYLLPRDAKYKVISNNTVVSLAQKDGTKETVTIVQLEEL